MHKKELWFGLTVIATTKGRKMEEKKRITDEIEAIKRRVKSANSIDKTVIHVNTSDTDDKKECILKSGNWEDKEAWFTIGEDKQLHTLVSLESLNRLINSLKSSQDENFNLKLEKTIWKYVPVDFGDAWAVAMDEVKAIHKKEKNLGTVNINLNHLVKNIKKKHPNLFLNIDDFLPSDFKQIH